MEKTKNTPARKGVPTLLVAGNWEQCWRETLNAIRDRGITKLHLTDFDGTKYEDILVQANEVHGPIDPVTGGKRWRIYDAAFKQPDGIKVPNGMVLPDRAVLRGDRMYMSNGAHLDAEYRDLMEAMRRQHPDADPLEKLIEWVSANIPLIPGAESFIDSLTRLDIATVGITNGAWQIAEALLVHNGLDIPFMGNYFQDGGFRCVHGDDVGVDKARLVEIAHEMGFQIVSCAGDSKGDVGLSTATAKFGGLVIVRGSEGGLAAWASENLKDNQWVLVEDYVGKEALSAVQQRIGETASV